MIYIYIYIYIIYLYVYTVCGSARVPCSRTLHNKSGSGIIPLLFVQHCCPRAERNCAYVLYIYRKMGTVSVVK